MRDEQLYELARQRVDRGIQRFLLLGINFFAFLLFVAAFAGLGIVSSSAGKFIVVAWMAVLILHVVLLFAIQYRKEAIEGEVENLRQEIYDEKPKRLMLDEDGELADDERETDSVSAGKPAHKARRDSV